MLHNEAEIFNCLNRVMIEWFSLWSVDNTERKHLFNGQCGTKLATKSTPMREGVHACLRLARAEFPSFETLHLEKNTGQFRFVVTHQQILASRGSLHT